MTTAATTNAVGEQTWLHICHFCFKAACLSLRCALTLLQVQLAVLQALTSHVMQFGDAALEFLVQRVLMVLTYVHRRAPGSSLEQLQTLAHACFAALRAADTCQVSLIGYKQAAYPSTASMAGKLVPAWSMDTAEDCPKRYVTCLEQ